MDGDLCVWEPCPPRQMRRINRRSAQVMHEPENWMDLDGEVWV